MQVRLKNVSGKKVTLRDNLTGDETYVPAHSEVSVEERFTKILPSYVQNLDRKPEAAKPVFQKTLTVKTEAKEKPVTGGLSDN